MRWWHFAALIVVFEFAVALLIGQWSAYRYQIPIGDMALATLGIVLIGTFSYAFIRVVYFAAIKEPEPLQRLVADLKKAHDFPILVFLAGAQMTVLGWLKSAMPHVVGFWADPLLAEWDNLLFGRDPWELANAAPPWIGSLIDQLYVTWGMAGLGLLIALGFARASETRSSAFLSYFLLMGLSSLAQYFLPSAGPVFYEAVGHGGRFAEMPLQPWLRNTASYLWENYQHPGEKIGTGISAWPSVHVAVAAWIALVFGSYLPRLKTMGWAYFVIILFGSVYLGWHYAVDGFGGLAIALFSWRFACRVLSPAERSRASPTSEAAPAME